MNTDLRFAFIFVFLWSYFSFAGGTTQTSPNLVINPTCTLPFSTGWSGAAGWGCEGNWIYPYAEAADSEALQTVDVHPYQTFISNGNVIGVFSVNIWTSVDKAALYVSFLDVSKNYISNWGSNNLVSSGAWGPQTLQGVIPSNTHYVKIELVCRYLSGSGSCNVWFDTPSLTLTHSTVLHGLTYSINGGRGSSFQQSSSTLYFVESNAGTLSSYSTIRNLQAIQFDANRTMTVNSSLDLVLGNGIYGGQIGLDYLNENTNTFIGPLNLRPYGSCSFSLLGYVPFTPLNQASLQTLIYDYEYIPFPLLQPGFVFAVWNPNKVPGGTQFDYAKIMVTAATSSPATVTLHITTYNLVGYSAYQVLGYGYLAPQDVKITSDGKTAYITEGAGNLLMVDLTASNKNRSAAYVIASGLGNLRELQLDQTHHIGYTISYGAPGTLWSVDLVTGTANPILSNLYYSAGLLLDATLTNAYVSEAPPPSYYYYVSKVNLVTTAKSSYAPAFSSIYSLTWTDSTQTSILLTTPSSQAIYLLSIGQSPATSSVVWSTYPAPESVVVTSPGQILVVQDTEISQYSLSDANFNALGPSLLGIGYVPVTAITGGYATTSSSYFFYVQNSPFGGTLPLMVNHDKARSLGASYYKILYDGVAQTNSWNDYKWDPIQNTFVIATTSADSNSRFPVRTTGTIWYNYWLGYFLDTTVYSDNQIHTISVQFLDASGNVISVATSSVNIFVDNNWPHANIQTIYHTLDNGTVQAVGACDIITGTSDQFSFQIDASDLIGQNLLSWSLIAYWGANQAGSVSSDTYSPGHSAYVNWLGPYYTTVPSTPWHATVAGDPTSRACAHTFSLGVWDRSINGWGYLHYSAYQVSLTLLLS